MREQTLRESLQMLKASRNRTDRAIQAIEELIEYDIGWYGECTA